MLVETEEEVTPLWQPPVVAAVRKTASKMMWVSTSHLRRCSWRGCQSLAPRRVIRLLSNLSLLVNIKENKTIWMVSGTCSKARPAQTRCEASEVGDSYEAPVLNCGGISVSQASD